eukprot:COSAG02_NODE_62492_length_265_cov_2.409639_1_plen_33_part_10
MVTTSPTVKTTALWWRPLPETIYSEATRTSVGR